MRVGAVGARCVRAEIPTRLLPPARHRPPGETIADIVQREIHRVSLAVCLGCSGKRTKLLRSVTNRLQIETSIHIRTKGLLSVWLVGRTRCRARLWARRPVTCGRRGAVRPARSDVGDAARFSKAASVTHVPSSNSAPPRSRRARWRRHCSGAQAPALRPPPPP